MKSFVYLALVMSLPVGAADFPDPTDRIADCENRWFLVASRTPESRVLGFAYVDPDAGPTFEHDGEVVLTADGQWRRKPSELEGKARLIVRVEENLPVVCLDDARTAQLGLSAAPEWLAWYKDPSAPGPHNARWAFYYNHIGAHERALRHVDAARAEGFQSRNLAFEHGYALNALERYSEARGVLDAAVQAYPRDPNMIAELGYAQLGLGDYATSIETYKQAYALDVDNASGRRYEFAQNIAAAYSNRGDSAEAAKWQAIAQAGAADK